MGEHTVNRKALAAELFQVTGEAVPEGDPIITGALFFSHTLARAGAAAAQEIRDAARQGAIDLREAGRAAGQQLHEASQSLAIEAAETARKANRSAAAAEAMIERLVNERTQHLKAVEVQMLRCVKLVSQGQASQQGTRYVPLWYVALGSMVGTAAITAVLLFGFDKGGEREREAAIGRSFSRTLPTLPPKLKAQLLKHIQKTSG
jgi:hypothetical protein